ncbi:small GTPase superfamily [Spinellus fusiger]|nr:small GTPase superfamily [Spinellus fusiger]
MMLCGRKKAPLQKKLVVCGDGTCGKTSLLNVFTSGLFPETYEPTVFENYVQEISIDGKNIELSLWDTAGQEDFDRLRALSYTGAHVIMMCFSVDNRQSLENITHRWLDEISEHCANAKIILVALKCDLRSAQEKNTTILYEEGLEVAHFINASCYLECSAKHNRGVRECFEQAARATLSVNFPLAAKHSNSCIIL